MSAMGAVRLPWRTIAPRLARPPLRPPALRLHRPMHTGPTRPFPSRLLLALVPLGLGSATLLADRDTERPAALVPSTDFLPTPGLALDERPGTLYRVLDLLREYLVEPLCTTGRFIHLAILFLPVLLTAPILLLELVEGGSSRRRRVKRVTERGSTRWWYGFLVAQMARAGPTFIKVSRTSHGDAADEDSSRNGPAREPISSLPSSASSLGDCTRTASPTRSDTPSASSSVRLDVRLPKSSSSLGKTLSA